MKKIDIYREALKVETLDVDQQDSLNKKIGAENAVTLSVKRPEPLALQVGDYITLYDERYELLDYITYSLSEGLYHYNLSFQSSMYRINSYLMPTNGSDSFYYFGTLEDHVNMVLALINEKDQGGWGAGAKWSTRPKRRSGQSRNARTTRCQRGSRSKRGSR